jgi:hypothetical protein
MSLLLTHVISQKRREVLGIVLGRDWSTETKVVETFDRCGLETMRVQLLDEVISLADGGINYENVSWH